MRKGYLVSAILAAACASIVGCKGLNDVSGTNTGTGTLHVFVEQINCSGRVSNVQISIDGIFEGTGQPGDSGVTINVAPGNHSVSAVSAEGNTWGPTTVTVNDGATTSVPLQCHS